MDLQLNAEADERRAHERLGRIESLERAAGSVAGITEIASEVIARHGADMPTTYGPLPPSSPRVREGHHGCA